MEVIAVNVGHDGICVRQPGESFQMPDGAVGSWFRRPEAEKPDVDLLAERRAREATRAPSTPDGAAADPLSGKTGRRPKAKDGAAADPPDDSAPTGSDA